MTVADGEIFAAPMGHSPRPWIAFGILATLAGCASSVDDIRNKPALWTATYQAPFDKMATCIVGRSAALGTVTPEIYVNRKLAYVTLGQPPYFPVYAQYRIEGTEAGTVVSFSHWVNTNPTGARENVDRCAKQS